ncbi:MAG: MFS transporter [Proteobacteria bacterium]|nr:MFS transporter [Pseudomonadota bacterium]
MLAAWSLTALFFGYAFIQRVSPSIMVEELMRDFAVGAALLGNLSAFYFYAYAGLQIPIGVLMDRIGPRRLLTGAAVLCAIGSIVFALADGAAMASFGRLLIGAGAGFSWVGALTVVTQWFPPQRFALLGGLTQAAGMAGAVFGQAPVAAVVAVTGWRWTLAAFAALGLIFALGMWLLVRDRPHAATAATGLGAGLRRVAANPQTWASAIFGLALTGPMLAFGGLWGVPWLTTIYGLERAGAGATLSLLFIGWAIGCPLIGWGSDRWRRRKPIMVAGAAIAAATLPAILYIPALTLALMSVLMFLHGCGASCMVLTFACARENNPPGLSGSAYGFVNTAVVGSGALFQPLLGLLLDLNWDGALVAGARLYSAKAYELAFAALPVGCALGVLAALVIRETYGRSQA